jgi:hypothetical protein
LAAKNIFLQNDFNNFLRCKKCFYLARHSENFNRSRSDFDYSNLEIHKLACSLFPDAIYIDQSKTLEEKIKNTSDLINQKKTIIGGWFCFHNLYIFIDILEYHDGWIAYGIHKNNLRNVFQIEDLALHFLIAKNNNLNLIDYNLIYLNKKYTRKDQLEISKLFIIKSVFEKIFEVKADLEKILLDFQSFFNESTTVSKIKSKLESKLKSKIKKIDIGEYCFKPVVCDFKETCWAHIPDNSVFEIAALSRDTKFMLYRKGIISQNDIEDFQDFTEPQIMQIKTIKNYSEIIDRNSLSHFLSDIKHPVFYMDFESFMPAIPLFKNTRPFQHIPVQYSLIKKVSRDSKEVLYDFLATPPEYPVKSFIKSLLKDLGNKGSIFVYDQRLETRQLREIAALYPEYASQIESVIERIIDLIIPFQKRFFYTPKMKGLCSLKNTLPAIQPEFSYQNLVIQNGYMAITALESLYYEHDKNVIKITRENLKQYCQLDTLAMVKIHEFFNTIAS